MKILEILFSPVFWIVHIDSCKFLPLLFREIRELSFRYMERDNKPVLKRKQERVVSHSLLHRRVIPNRINRQPALTGIPQFIFRDLWHRVLDLF